MISRTNTAQPCNTTGRTHKHKIVELQKALEDSATNPKIALSVQDIKHSKDRINAFRNTCHIDPPDADFSISQKEKAKSRPYDDDEKDTCEGSDTESLTDIKCRNIVHSRIASYEAPNNDISSRQQVKYKRNPSKPDSAYSNEIEYKLTRKIPTVDSHHVGRNQTSDIKNQWSFSKMKSTDNLICKLRSDANSLVNESVTPSNVIVGNKDVLKLLSNRHLENLNIKVDMAPDDRRFRTENKIATSVLASKTGVRTSFRSSKRILKRNFRTQVTHQLSSEEKGMSDSTLKENESESELSNQETHLEISNKRDGANCQSEETVRVLEALQRNLSSSPIEKAPVVKKIVSGTRSKKDNENRKVSVNRSDSSKGQRVARRASLNRNNKTKLLTDSEAKNSAVRLRKRNSRCSKNSEYRVSVTIKPSTVADLTNKFNTLSQKSNSLKTEITRDVQSGSCQVKLYSSPRASFRRKYRHKTSKVTKESTKAMESSKQKQNKEDGHYLDIPLQSKRSLANSLSDLTVKDFIEDEDYNKTDEEKVCEKIKTALSSSKFVGETDESDEDKESLVNQDEGGSAVLSEQLNNKNKTIKVTKELNLIDGKNKNSRSSIDSENHCKSSSSDSGILVDEDKIGSAIQKMESTEELDENVFVEEQSNGDTVEHILEAADTITDKNKEFQSLETIKSGDSGISSLSIDNTSTALEVDLLAKKICKMGAACEPIETQSTKDSTINKNESTVIDECSEESDQKIKNDSKLYSSLKNAVKNTVKSAKEKDSIRRENAKVQKPPSSKEKRKWFSRGRSKERKRSTEDDEKELKADTTLKRGRESSLYEKFLFKRSKEKNVQSDAVEDFPVNSQRDGSDSADKTSKIRTYDSADKTFPPPPKTPIPSPPLPFKRFFMRSKTKKEDKYVNNNDVSDPETEENVYENLQTADQNKLAHQRVLLDKEGIRPNPSFLWSTSLKTSTTQSNFSALDPSVICKESNSEFYGESSLSEPNGLLSSCDSLGETPGYSEITEKSNNHPVYDGIGSGSAVSYDEIGAPARGYDDVRPSSEFPNQKTPQEGYDSVSPPKSEGEQYDDIGIVTAKLAVVKEDQMDSICYAYDDIGVYNVSTHSNSYEPVCPPDGIVGCAASFKSSSQYRTDSTSKEEALIDSDDSENIHEVFSYELTETLSQMNQMTKSPVQSRSRRSDLKMDYQQLNDEQVCLNQEKLIQQYLQQKLLEGQATLSFNQPCPRAKRRPRYGYPTKNPRATWTQGYRRYIKANPNVIRKYKKFTSQAMRPSKSPRQDSENDEDQAGHYEAIYEVIHPEDKTQDLLDEGSDDYQDDFDDSFDSDESDEAYSRLQPSVSDEIYGDPQQGGKIYDRSQSYQPHSMTKIAEAANIGMKRLRRNWSYTKHEVKTGISKIKKKSAFSATDIKATESTLSMPSSSSTTEKSKSWSLKNHFRRKSTSGLPSELSKLSIAPSQTTRKDKDRPTFYLTLTLSSDSQEDDDPDSSSGVRRRRNTEGHPVQRRKSATPSISSTATSASCNVGPAYQKSRSSSHVPIRSVSSRSSGGPSRPTTAPPEPPLMKSVSTEDNSGDISKDALALRLNQILSSGPMYPKGRRILKSPECSESDYSPPVVPSKNTDNESSTKYASITCPPRTPRESNLAADIIHSVVSNTPQARYSIASSSSNTSSEGYIRPSDIASAPPPLPARPASTSHSFKRHSSSGLWLTSPSSDVKSYLDLETGEPDQPTYISSHFPHEPLYQFYTAKVERAALFQGESSEDDYEVINDGTTKTALKLARPTAMELVSPAYGRRTLWCELPEVVSSGILSNITGQDRKIQEAMFEVMTSEASYLKSLEILVTHFMNCPEFNLDDETIMCKQESKILFSDILPVKKSSEMFLADLEERWQECVQISKITDIILKHSESFNVYVKYCSNQIYQDRMLRKLKENNPRFVEVLTRLESSPSCQSLAMHSFLMLPMQRITRLPLLFDAIFNRLEYGSSQWQECKAALATLTKVVAECNEGARKMERMEEMLLVSRQLDFREVKAIPLISASRWLVKKGELTRLTWRENDAKLTFGRKISKHSLYFFLFSDLLVVTKKKSDDQHLVLDYCPRNMVQVLELENANRFPGRILEGYKNLLIMTMLHNHENKTVEMVLSCPLESDRSRWIEAVTPRTSENPDERIYEEWDCPQVQSVHPYPAMQPDELSLEISDVINVLKKTSDGWYQGERLRDGEKGWFPGNHTVEVASAHVRARNLRQRYRLLVISGSFIDKEKKERDEKVDKKKERRRRSTLKESVK